MLSDKMRSANSLDQYNDDDFFSGGPCPSCRLAINKETGRLKFVRCSKLVTDFIKNNEKIKSEYWKFFFFFLYFDIAGGVWAETILGASE